MRITISGEQYHIERQDILNATLDIMPEIPDSRNKYFVTLHERSYPIKQVLHLVTGLPVAGFISDDAYRVLTKLDFDVSDRSLPGLEPSRSPNGDGRTLSLLVTFETDEDGWEVASCPTLPGCHSQGRTRNEALANIKEAIRGYLASMREHGEPTPSSTEFAVVKVKA